MTAFVVTGDHHVLESGDYVDLGATNVPGAFYVVNTDTANAAAFLAEFDDGDSFLPLATLGNVGNVGQGVVVAAGSAVTVVINTASAGLANGGNLIISTDGVATVFVTPVKVL